MDKEILRKQVFDEVQAQFETKLRDAKRQKSQAEHDLESASERWRTERRRLNSEIDRLESAAAEARENRKKAGKAGDRVDPGEIAKIQAAAEEKLKKAAQKWETEREELRKEIARLERAVAELLERSNNPLRSTAKDARSQARLDEALSAKDQIEQDFRAAKDEWEEEKKQLLTRPEKTGRELEKARGEWESRQRELESESKKLREQNALLKRRADEAVHAASQHQSSTTLVTEQLRDALQRRQSVEQQLAAANKDLSSLRAAYAEDRANFERQISALQAELENERSKKSLGSQPPTAVSEQLREALQRRHFVEQELAAANDALKSLRAAKAEDRANLEKQISHLQTSKNGDRTVVHTNGDDTGALSGELSRVEEMIAEVTQTIEDPSAELSVVIRKNVERAELDAYMRGILFSMGRRKAM